jgi:hypothetical protein
MLMAGELADLVLRWMERVGIDLALAPDRYALERAFPEAIEPCRPGASVREIAGWEERHGYRFPAGLRDWLQLSNGLYRCGPLIHPISAIGPMIPFARVPEMIVQPESWFELGNPNFQTICIDLAYRLPGGDHPIFTSGDDARGSPPRIIARGFEHWFLELVRQGGREYWFDADFEGLGAPWLSHRRHAPRPHLSESLRRFADRVTPLVHAGTDEREIAERLGLSRTDVELILRHLQHIGAVTPAPQRASS